MWHKAVIFQLGLFSLGHVLCPANYLPKSPGMSPPDLRVASVMCGPWEGMASQFLQILINKTRWESGQLCLQTLTSVG